MPPVKTQPDWYSLSHHDRYRKLNIVRRKWCRLSSRGQNDLSNRTVYLEGAWIDDVPSFYLSLGEAINGSDGYFGGGLDALADCLTGGFGVLPPLTIRLSHYDDVRAALDGWAWCRFHAESFQEAVTAGESREQLVDWGYFDDGSPADVARWTATYAAALAGERFDCDEFGSYFEAIVEFLKAGGAEIVSVQG